MTRWTWAALATALVISTGCKDDGLSPDDDTNGVDGLVDPMEQVSGDDPPCEEFVDGEGLTCTGVEGATAFFVAEVTTTESEETEGVYDLSGTFYYVHFANEWWAEYEEFVDSKAGQAGKDYCSIAWALTGTMSDTVDIACGVCDKGITYSLQLDNSLTDCPDNKVATVEASYVDASWGLVLGSDGSASSWDTQQEWAPNGQHNEDGFVLWSDGWCEWYGSGTCE